MFFFFADVREVDFIDECNVLLNNVDCITILVQSRNEVSHQFYSDGILQYPCLVTTLRRLRLFCDHSNSDQRQITDCYYVIRSTSRCSTYTYISRLHNVNHFHFAQSSDLSSVCNFNAAFEERQLKVLLILGRFPSSFKDYSDRCTYGILGLKCRNNYSLVFITLS
jgi:hypothetical protein